MIFLSQQNPALGQMAGAWINKLGSDLFTVKPSASSLEDFKKFDIVVTMSDQSVADSLKFPSSVRHYHWVVPSHEAGQRSLHDEMKLYVSELIQTFRSPTTQKEPLIDKSWSRYYQEKKTAWDLEGPSPPFVRLYREGTLKRGKMAVPGCGKGHEVIFFAREKFEVTAIDFTEEAILIVKKRLQEEGLTAELVQTDFLKLDRRFDGKFDTILEQTCYCAIEPVKRADYVRTVHRLLRPHGEYIALFYDIENVDGPPFGTSNDEVRQRFAPFFKIERLEKMPYSHERRSEKEWLGIFRKEG